MSDFQNSSSRLHQETGDRSWRSFGSGFGHLTARALLRLVKHRAYEVERQDCPGCDALDQRYLRKHHPVRFPRNGNPLRLEDCS